MHSSIVSTILLSCRFKFCVAQVVSEAAHGNVFVFPELACLSNQINATFTVQLRRAILLFFFLKIVCLVRGRGI